MCVPVGGRGGAGEADDGQPDGHSGRRLLDGCVGWDDSCTDAPIVRQTCKEGHTDHLHPHICGAATAPLKVNPVAPTNDIRLTFLESNSWLWQVRSYIYTYVREPHGWVL